MYVPEVDDYVIWERPNGNNEEGWVYFKGSPSEEKRGWPKRETYITIEIGVKPKPKCEYTRKDDPHKMIHVLLLCYENQWEELKYVKSRKHTKDSVERDNLDYIEYTKIHGEPEEDPYQNYKSQPYRYRDIQ